MPQHSLGQHPGIKHTNISSIGHMKIHTKWDKSISFPLLNSGFMPNALRLAEVLWSNQFWKQK